MQKEDKKLIIHLISDSTGETLKSVGSAAAAQFDQLEYEENVYPLIRSKKNLKRVFDKIKSNPGIVLCTLVDDEIRKKQNVNNQSWSNIFLDGGCKWQCPIYG